MHIDSDMSENETIRFKYDRREDEEPSREDLVRAIESGKPTVNEIVKRFGSSLLEELG